MVGVTCISSLAEIPDWENFVLIRFGDRNISEKHSRGFNLILDNMPDDTKNFRLAIAIDDAILRAEEVGARTIFVIA